MKITAMTQSLVLHFGEMGSRWGLNRTLGQRGYCVDRGASQCRPDQRSITNITL